jgi:hypothetical protein
MPGIDHVHVWIKYVVAVDLFGMRPEYIYYSRCTCGAVLH